MRILLTLAALVAASSAADAGPLGICTPRGEPGPVRQFIHNARPGIIFPKDAAPQRSSCAGCQAAPTYAPAPQVVQASYAPSYAPQYLPAYPFPASNCPNGKCPLK